MDKIKKWSVAGGIVTTICGTLLHFTYDFWGGNFWAVFGAVNESTWEHLKLLFWPALAMSAVEYIIIGRKLTGFLYIRLIGVLAGMAFVVVSFYTYSGILGHNLLAVDIGVFLMGVIVVYAVSCQMFKKFDVTELCDGDTSLINICSVASWTALILLFIIFTYETPRVGMFEDPVTNQYGIQ